MEIIIPTINNILYRETFTGWAIPKRRIRDNELVFITEGSGYTKIEDKEYKLTAGTVVYYSSKVAHSLWITHEPYMKFYAVHFDTEAPLCLPHIFHPSDFKAYASQMKKLCQLTRQPQRYKTWETTLELSSLILKLYKSFLEKNSPIQKQRIEKSISYMDAHYSEKITLDNLCNMANLNKTEFCREFKEETGKSPIDYLLWLRIEKAKELLMTTNHKINEISYMCGFYDEFYFSKLFKRFTNISPKDFRKMI